MLLLIMLLQFPPRPTLQSDLRPPKPALQTLRVNPEAADAALAEVNAKRAARGLPPFAYDAGLTAGARKAAQLRAAQGIAGHLANDFACLPPGVHAKAAGCAALEPSWGWGACCTFDNYDHAGAAIVIGQDGRRYMHLFVR